MVPHLATVSLMTFLPTPYCRDRRAGLLFAALLAASPFAAHSAAPIIDEPVPVNGENFPTRVEPRVPVGKSLIFPITADAQASGPLTYTVTSDNPKIHVSVRTGLPKMKVLVDHAGDGTAEDPAFSGELEFALLRDLAPLTVGNISGFANGHFYNYSGGLTGTQIFHRIANLDPSEEPEGSYILQGGDPKGTGSGGPGFAFDNEFHPSAMLNGRGQLAMANAGTNDLNNRGTNGSQFFITLGQPRFLDFNHTVFGQLLRGWDLIESIADVPRTAPNADPANKPLVDVKLVSTTIEQNFSDAILIISASGAGTANITVKAKNPGLEETEKEFTVTAYKDTHNSPPFLLPVPNQTAQKEKILGIPLETIDLERDYFFNSHSVLFSSNARSSSSGSIAYILGNAGFVGPINFGIGVTQYDMDYRGPVDGPARSTDDKIGIAVAIGDKEITAKGQDIGGSPGVELNNVLLASYVDGDPAALPSDFTALVIWGDGSFATPPTQDTAGNGRFTATIARDPNNPFSGSFVVKASHTYQHPGTYPVTVELSAPKGQRVTLRSTAVISADTLRVFGKALQNKGLGLNRSILATLTDSPAAPLNAYTTQIHWGDGTNSAGEIVRSLQGDLQVVGSHNYANEGEYAVTVEVTKAGGPTAYAWSRIEISNPKAPPVRPPFDTPHLVGQMGDAANIGNAVGLVRNGNQTSAAVQLIILNAGTKPSKPGKVRFYLSEDKKTNLADETIPDPSNPGSTIFNPKDLPLKIGSLKEVKLQSLPPGAGIRYVFTKSSQGDFRLKFPSGEGGQGLTILAHIEYSDPLADNLPISRDVTAGPFNPIIVQPTTLTVKELGGADASKTFTVKLARAPRADVTTTITLNAAAGNEITVQPTTLTFTPDNWNTAQAVTVTAKEDNVNGDNKNVTVTLNPATSTDLKYRNQDPADVTVAVQDKSPTP